MITAAEVAQAAQLHLVGKTWAEISQVLHYDRYTLCKQVSARYGPHLRPAEAYRLHLGGMAWRDVAAQLGYTDPSSLSGNIVAWARRHPDAAAALQRAARDAA